MDTDFYLGMMESLLQDLGYHKGLDEDGRIIATAADLESFGKRLSNLVGKKPEWSYNYMRAVLNEKLKISAPLKDALERLAVSLDGKSTVTLDKKEVVVLAQVGTVAPGSIVLVPSKSCANPVCGVNFIPKTWNQKYCCPSCNDTAKAIKKGTYSNG